MGSVVSATMAPIFHSFRLLSVYFVHLPFTFYACGLFASNWLSRVKTPVCVTTILVRVVTLSAPCNKVLRQSVSRDCNV